MKNVSVLILIQRTPTRNGTFYKVRKASWILTPDLFLPSSDFGFWSWSKWPSAWTNIFLALLTVASAGLPSLAQGGSQLISKEPNNCVRCTGPKSTCKEPVLYGKARSWWLRVGESSMPTTFGPHRRRTYFISHFMRIQEKHKMTCHMNSPGVSSADLKAN